MLSCDCRNAQPLYLAIVGIGLFCSLACAEFPKFEYHQIARIGNKMGQTSLVDLDKDGDLDWIAGCNGLTIWWFEYKAPDNWGRHTLGQKAPTDVGGTAFDIDGKGRIFKQHIILSGKRCHEAKAADVNGDGDIDICSKPWNGDEHVYLRNLLNPNSTDKILQ